MAWASSEAGQRHTQRGRARFLHLRRARSLDPAGAFEEDSMRRETEKDEGPWGPPFLRMHSHERPPTISLRK